MSAKEMRQQGSVCIFRGTVSTHGAVSAATVTDDAPVSLEVLGV